MDAKIRRFWIGLAFLFLLDLGSRVYAEAVVGNVDLPTNDDAAAAFEQKKALLIREVNELRSQLAHLESKVKKDEAELSAKDKKISSLENELEIVQKKRPGEQNDRLESAHAKVKELEATVKKLEQSLVRMEKDAKTLQQRAEAAESAYADLSSKYSKAEKTIQEQKRQIKRGEEALRIAESAMLQAEAEAAAKAQELFKAYNAWLPPWAASRAAQWQAAFLSHWATYGEPFVNDAFKRASIHGTAAVEWAKPHIENVRMKLGPATKKYWDVVLSQTESISGKVQEHFEVLKTHLTPHYHKACGFVAPHVKEFRAFVGPHIENAAVVLRPYYEQAKASVAPHLEKARPYTDKVINSYQVFSSSAAKYHRQLQVSVREALLKHELSAALASKEFIWFLASAMLVLPGVSLLLLLSSAFGGKKPSKPRKNSSTAHSGNSHRKHKRAKVTDNK